MALRLTLDRVQPLGGIIQRLDGTDARRFSGWVDLMTVIEALLAGRAVQPGGGQEITDIRD